MKRVRESEFLKRYERMHLLRPENIVCNLFPNEKYTGNKESFLAVQSGK